MRVIDLGWQLTNGMPVFPGDLPPTVKRSTSVEREGFAESLLTLGSHNGTHMDAPAHLCAGGKTLDMFTNESFFGLALVVDVTKRAGEEIKTADISSSVRNGNAVDFILLRTGWSDRWGDQSYASGYPILSEEAARWLTRLGLKGIGIDALSFDAADDETCKIHRILLEQELLLIENMRALDMIGDEPFCFTALPLSFENADGAPVRVMAVLE